jgi:hypothetical protein
LSAFGHEFTGIGKGEIMDQVFGDKDSQVLSESTEIADLPARRVWVKPVLERLSLQDALTGGAGATDGPESGGS